jgi:hypothetical protein
MKVAKVAQECICSPNDDHPVRGKTVRGKLEEKALHKFSLACLASISEGVV